jgi:excisionase family DNA binding protein
MPRWGVQIALRACDLYERSCVFLANRLESSYACRHVKVAPPRNRVEKETPMASSREQASKSTYLLPSEVAEVLQVSPKTVTRWAKEGKLPSRRTLGGHRRYARADIESLVERLQEQIPA